MRAVRVLRVVLVQGQDRFEGFMTIKADIIVDGHGEPPVQNAPQKLYARGNCHVYQWQAGTFNFAVVSIMLEAMTLLDAKEFNPEKESRKRIIIIVTVVVVVLLLGWWFWYWPEEHRVGTFFDALQKQDFKSAYAIWQHDPEWQQHPGNYPTYSFNEFYRDWGPGGQWGVIKTAKINGAHPCPSLGGGTSGSGILVDVIVNDRVEHAQVWVEHSNHTLGYPPCELIFH